MKAWITEKVKKIKLQKLNENSDLIKVESFLAIKSPSRFIPPSLTQTPTVDASTRYQIEKLASQFEFMFGRNGSRLVRENFEVIKTALSRLTSESTNTVRFPFSKLHGYTASKSQICNNYERGILPSMAALGAVLDFPKYRNLNSHQIIEDCKMWPEARFNNEINIFTDNWHKRYYWSNNGGSHHTAFLIHQLVSQGKEWNPTVNLTKHRLNIEALKSLEGKLSIFVCMHSQDIERSMYDQSLIYDLGIKQLEIKLGLGVLPLKLRSNLMGCRYQLFFIDHSRELSAFSLDQAFKLVKEKLAVPMDVFLKDLESQ